MTWEVFTFLAVVSRSFYSLASRNLSVKVKVSAITQTFLIFFVSGIIAVFISPLIGGIQIPDTSTSALAVLLLIFSSTAGNILYFSGQKNLDVGTTQVAFSSILVWGMILSIIVLGSRLTPIQIAGSALLLIAILLTQKSFTKVSTINKSVLLILSSSLMFSLFQVLSADISQKMSADTYLVITNFGVALALASLSFRQIKSDLFKLFSNKSIVITSTLFACGTSLLYFVFSYLAYQRAPDQGLVVILLTSQVIFSVLLGIILLRERDNLFRKFIAALLTLVAAFLIKS